MELKMFHLRCLGGLEEVDKNSTGCRSPAGGVWGSK